MSSGEVNQVVLTDEDVELLAEATRLLSQAAWFELVQPILPQLEEQLRPLSEVARRFDWAVVGEGVRRFSKERREEILRLAEFGWTIGSHIPVLLEMDASVISDRQSADAIFVELYRENNWKIAKKAIEQLKASPYLNNRSLLLKQVLSALRRGHCAIAVPSLVILLEGYLAAMTSNPSEVRDKKALNRLLQEEAKSQSSKTVFLSDVWPGLRKFFEHLFKDRDFAASPPSLTNRHWILHGRSPDEQAEADAVRLLNALSTLDWLLAWPFPEDSEYPAPPCLQPNASRSRLP